MPRSYITHPVYARNSSTRHERPIVPQTAFIDGAPHSLVDNVIGIWITNLIDQLTHYIGTVRKSICCTCGFRG